MRYLMVKPKYDNMRRCDGNIYIKNELYTPKEAIRYRINPAYCTVIEVSRKAVYFCFGARFCNAKGVKKIY